MEIIAILLKMGLLIFMGYCLGRVVSFRKQIKVSKRTREMLLDLQSVVNQYEKLDSSSPEAKSDVILKGIEYTKNLAKIGGRIEALSEL